MAKLNTGTGAFKENSPVIRRTTFSERIPLFQFVAVLAVGFCFSPTYTHSQTINLSSQGNNAVWLTSSTVQGTTAFIDASAFCATGCLTDDFCVVLNTALTKVPPIGGVVDARGVMPTPSQTINCGSNPWGTNIPPSGWPPSTVLLPAGVITLLAPTDSWTLPNQTRIIGTGMNPNAGTVISAGVVAGWSGVAMIQMGSNCPAVGSYNSCSGVSVENAMVIGNSTKTTNTGIIGIRNANSGDLSFVDHVNLRQINGVGLEISGISAAGSGPYSNIAFSADPLSQTDSLPTTVCVSLAASSTRGIRGLTCTADGTPLAAVLVDGSNNTLEDIHIEGHVDGILVGANAPAQGNIISNVQGAPGAGPITNVIHISNAVTGNVPNVSDLSITTPGSNGGNGGGGPPNTVQDDLTNTTLTNNLASNLAVYILGEPVVGTPSGYSRFATSPAIVSSHNPSPVATWVVGSGSIPSGTPCSLPGAIFSNTSGIAQTTIYVCSGGTWQWIA